MDVMIYTDVIHWMFSRISILVSTYSAYYGTMTIEKIRIDYKSMACTVFSGMHL